MGTLSPCRTKTWHMSVDFSHHAPAFVIEETFPFALEATIAAPAAGGKPAYGYSARDIPADFTQFNIEAKLRICNSFAEKVKRLREDYVNLPHMAGRRL